MLKFFLRNLKFFLELINFYESKCWKIKLMELGGAQVSLIFKECSWEEDFKVLFESSSEVQGRFTEKV